MSWLYVIDGYVAQNGVRLDSKTKEFAEWYKEVFQEDMEHKEIYEIQTGNVTLTCYTRESLDKVISKLQKVGLEPINYQSFLTGDYYSHSYNDDNSGSVRNPDKKPNRLDTPDGIH